MGPTRFGLGDLLRRTAALGHFVQGFTNVGSEEDYAARTPRCSAAFGRIAEHLHRSAGQRYFLQLSRRKKSNVLAIGRPERKGWPFDFHRSHCAGGYVAHPQLGFGSVTGEKGELRTIRGKCERTRRSGGEFRIRWAAARKRSWGGARLQAGCGLQGKWREPATARIQPATAAISNVRFCTTRRARI